MSTGASGIENAVMPPTALIVTALEGIESRGADLAERLKLRIEIASNRAAAVRLLSRRNYVLVMVDQILAESDPEGADLIWKSAGLAVPLQLNFALANSTRLEREIRSALARREREQQLAMTAATAAVDDALKNAITGFLLESQLALAEQNVPPRVETRLRTLAEMADRLRERLLPRSGAVATTGVSLLPPQQ
ncbi:MAG: hypothetical protein ACLGXA_12765 [Acidobacteriota bacterium]